MDRLGRDTGEALETLRVLVLGVLKQLGRLGRLYDARRSKRVRALRVTDYAAPAKRAIRHRQEGKRLTDWKVCLQTVH